jgi:hypothetical protein
VAFPTTSVLDDFNRANEGPPPSASWSAPMWWADNLKVISNTAGSDTTTGDAYWNAGTVGPACEAYADMTSLGSAAYLGVRMTSPGGTADGYFYFWRPGPNAEIARIDNGTRTRLGAAFDASTSAGDSLGISAVEDALTAHGKNGSWSVVAERVDGTYLTSGYIGLGVDDTTTRWDNFGGGTVVVGTHDEYGTFRTDKIRSRRTSW